MHNYARQAVNFSHGDGVWLWDDAGKPYLDALGGIAVCGLGHAHPAVTTAVAEQAGKLLHCSNLYRIDLQEQLASKLCSLSGMDRVFFANSGAEANEAAIKLARLHHRQKQPNTSSAARIVVVEGAFHGRTLATLSATGNPAVHKGFEPLVEGFIRVPFNDLEAIKQHSNDPDIAAVMLEPIHGEGGLRLAEKEYLQGIRQLCDQQGWLMILDEIQTGVGRTGRWFCAEHYNVHPDVLTSAKALGNGVPIGACLARGPSAELFQPGHHGSTFGGNPLACAAAMAVLTSIEQDNLLSRASIIGQTLMSGFRQALADMDEVIDIRGQGCMVGIELKQPCAELVALAREEGVLINVTAGNVVRLLPPLIMTDEQVSQLIDKLGDLIKTFLAANAD